MQKRKLNQYILENTKKGKNDAEKKELVTQSEIEEKMKTVIDELQKRGKTVATMESCTGGEMASQITNISGSSEVLRSSRITYCTEAKINAGVPKEIIDEHTVYSRQTAEAMARAIAYCDLGADFGIGVTGQLGRKDPGNDGGAVGQIDYAIYDKANDVVISNQLLLTETASRSEYKLWIVNAVVEMFKDKILCVENEKDIAER